MQSCDVASQASRCSIVWSTLRKKHCISDISMLDAAFPLDCTVSYAPFAGCKCLNHDVLSKWQGCQYDLEHETF